MLEKNGSSSKSKVKHVDMFGERNSFDEDEAYRRAKERAEAEWQIKTDLSKSKSAKPFKKSDLDDFIDDDDHPKKKCRDEPRIDDDFKNLSIRFVLSEETCEQFSRIFVYIQRIMWYTLLITLFPTII